MRFFEIPTANGLQLTSHCPEMDKEYRHREQVIYYNDDDVLEQARWALENPEACASIRQKAHALTNEKHTYFQRLQYILDHLKTGSH